MVPVQDHLSLINPQYLARVLQPNNPSHSVVTSFSSTRNMKQTLQSWFLHYVAPYLSSGILPSTAYGTTMKSHHTTTLSGSISLLSHNRVRQIASLQITPEGENSFFIHSYFCERIRMIPSPLCPPPSPLFIPSPFLKCENLLDAFPSPHHGLSHFYKKK